MGNLKERGEGVAREVGGKIEKTVGKAIGSERLATRGRARELEGQAQQEAAKARERVKGAAEEIAGSARKAIGKVVGDDEQVVKGEARRLEGKARRRANR